MSGENAITEERLKRVAGRAQDGRDEAVVYDDESSKSLCWRGPVPIAQVVGALVLMNCASKRHAQQRGSECTGHATRRAWSREETACAFR